jgi:hypothetical protein
MSVIDLKANILEAKKIIRDIKVQEQQLKYSNPKNRTLIKANINSVEVNLFYTLIKNLLIFIQMYI